MAHILYPCVPAGSPFIDILKVRSERAQFKENRRPNLHKWDLRIGFVYLVHFVYEDFYKIGQSRTPDKRVQKFGGIEWPIDLPIIHLIKTDDTAVVETS